MPQLIRTTQDAAALSFVQAQAYRINATVIEQPYPAWDFGELIYVETEGNPWAAGVVTYTSDWTGKPEFLDTAAKDMPFAEVSQDWMLKSFQLGGIGYQFNIGEVNTVLATIGGSLPNRRAAAARLSYLKFLYDTTLYGQPEKNMYGLTNYPGVPALVPPADGTGGVTWWVNNAGVGTKTPAQIVRDFNMAIEGVDAATFGRILANGVFLPEKAYTYLAQTPYSAATMETLLTFLQRTNSYTTKTGQQLRIRTIKELDVAATTSPVAGNGRMVAYNDSPSLVKLHLPMPHQFLPVHQDGWANFVIPGIFRTGGVEFMAPATAFYLDGITQAPA